MELRHTDAKDLPDIFACTHHAQNIRDRVPDSIDMLL